MLKLSRSGSGQCLYRATFLEPYVSCIEFHSGEKRQDINTIKYINNICPQNVKQNSSVWGKEVHQNLSCPPLPTSACSKQQS